MCFGSSSHARSVISLASAQVRRMLRWLTLNFVAVLKIAKKHDKRCGTTILEPISRVLVTEQFVRGLMSAPCFVGLECRSPTRRQNDGATTTDDSDGGPPVPSASAEEAAAAAAAVAMLAAPAAAPAAAADGAADAMVAQLLGRASAHYFPNALIARLEACQLVPFGASDDEADSGGEAPSAAAVRATAQKAKQLKVDSTLLGTLAVDLTRNEVIFWLSAVGTSLTVLCLAMCFEEVVL